MLKLYCVGVVVTFIFQDRAIMQNPEPQQQQEECSKEIRGFHGGGWEIFGRIVRIVSDMHNMIRVVL